MTPFDRPGRGVSVRHAKPVEPSDALPHESETTLDAGNSTDQVELPVLIPTGDAYLAGSAAFDREAACSALPTA